MDYFLDEHGVKLTQIFSKWKVNNLFIPAQRVAEGIL